MRRDFNYLFDQLGTEARIRFESICYDIYEAEFLDDDVHCVRVTQGDGGIDIFVNHEDGDYTVFQCKFFLKEIGDSQKNQIRESYKKVIETKGTQITKWVLCVPCTLSFNEHEWWDNWKKERKEKFEEVHGRKIKIKLHDNDKLLKLIKKHGLYDEVFDTVRIDQEFVHDLVKQDDMKVVHDRLYELISEIADGSYLNEWVILKIEQLLDLQAHYFFAKSTLINDLSELSSLISSFSINNVVRDTTAKEEIDKIRKRIVDEYKNLFF